MRCGARAALRLIADALAPPRCAVCGAPCESAATACLRCRAALEAAHGGSGSVGPGVALSWAAPYEGVARELVASLKFAGRLGLASLAADRLAARLDPQPGFVVVPVPAAPVRLAMRGFDPADEIAAALARKLALPCARALRRRGSRRQVGRGRAERLADPPRVRARGPAPARVLLVDDVLTTGATVGVCATALRAAGAADVRAAVFARTPVGVRARGA